MKFILIGLFLLMCMSTVHARCVGSIVNGECMGAEVYGSDDSGYQGSSGSTYQYDLNNLSDRNSYSIDLDAQMRDQRSIDTGRNMDQLRGQNGGGIYDY